MIYFPASLFLFYNRGDVSLFVDRLSFKSRAVMYELNHCLGDGGPVRPIVQEIDEFFLIGLLLSFEKDYVVFLLLASTLHGCWL